jgi:hypothetical protein
VGSRLAKATGPPAFFLQDPSDGSCLAGGEFKRCAIDTLWYVTGKPGHYQIHHRQVEETDDELCLDKYVCEEGHLFLGSVRASSGTQRCKLNVFLDALVFMHIITSSLNT